MKSTQEELVRSYPALGFRRAGGSIVRASAMALLMIHTLALGQARPSNGRWVATWSTAVVIRQPTPSQPAPQGPPPEGQRPGGQPSQATPPRPAIVSFSNQTLRQIVHTSIGGRRVRIVLSNAFGTLPLAVGAAHIALRDKDAKILPKSGGALTFSGRPATTILVGAVAVSDAVELAVPALADMAVDLYLPGDMATSASPLTIHGGASQTNYVSAAGNHTGATDLPVATTTRSWFLLARVEVEASEQTGAIVTLGDSITDGARSTPDTNSRWPDYLARRVIARPGKARLAVLNAGINGNRLLGESPAMGAGINALARFDRDVLMQTGVTHVIVLEGINDIGGARGNPSPSAADLIAAHQQLIERAHARGVNIYGATLVPFEGAGYWTPEGEAKRQALNQWIRTSKAYDGVIDFDAAVRDPKQPTKFLPEYDSGDHLHPSDAGYKAMGNAIDLGLFKLARR